MEPNQMTDQEKAALLAGLIGSQAPAHSEPAPQPRRELKPKAVITLGMYDRIVRIVGLIGALGIMVFLWGVGAYFTLHFLEGLGLKLAGAGLAAWLIPATITAMEIGLWPAKMPTFAARLAWFLVLAADTGTTAAGIVGYVQGQKMAGITLAGPSLLIIALALGIALALFPERGARSLWADLKRSLA
jgi:nitrate reductase NapE component